MKNIITVTLKQFPWSCSLTLCMSWPLAGAQLFYLDPSKKDCAAKLLEFSPETSAAKDAKILFTTEKCPSNMIFDGSSVYYTIDHVIYKKEGQHQAKRIANLPHKDAKLWLDPKKRGLRAIYLQELEQDKVEKTAEGNMTVTFEGKTYSHFAMGMPAMAFAVSLENGLWRRLEVDFTSWGTGEASNVMVLKSYQEIGHSAGIRIDTLSDKMTCLRAEGLQCGLKRADHPPFQNEKLEDLGLLNLQNKKTLYFNVVYGDSPHAAPPLFFCRQPCIKPKKIEKEFHSQLGLAVKDRYLLITHEYDGNSPKIFDTETETLLQEIPQAISAVWWP